MAPYGENRRSHVIAVDGVVVCPVLADFGTLPAISAKWKDTLLRHAGLVQQHIDKSHNKSSQRKGQRKWRQLTVSDPEVGEFTIMFKVGWKVHEPIVVSYSGCEWAPATNGSGHRCSSVCNLNNNSSKPLSHRSTKQYFNFLHDIHRRSNACGGRDESGAVEL